MSWFKRNERRSPESCERSRSDTDPNTCLEVFQNHWKQACAVLSGQDKKTTLNGQATVDGVQTVLHNMEQMVTLLVGEDDDGGLPGPILHYVMESDLLENFCSWCQLNVASHEKLRLEQLRLFEHLISQSKQMLLIHKPVIKPLLRLLIAVADSPEISSGELEFKLVLVLHQICICISQQSLILESFFSTDADHGPARFLIFSLLIPYIHREGPVGQRARDALLLIMTLSARHPHIGQYIARNSDFCPVLATGLSGLYSSLPRKIIPPSEEWHAITRDDCIRMPDLQMFLNSLQFSNAVVQIAHPLVRDQLIEFIYSGFLVPVLAPALHQDITGLPIPLLDTDLFRISREEVMTATAYLDLFIRHVTDPHLMKAVLNFIFVEKYDDVLLLDSLLSRINSSSHLSTVTLALFHTLVSLNCEDVMFQLVFRYLVPCTHVMVSQRRSVRDLDLYSKSAEKFLTLRPMACLLAVAQSLVPNTTPALPPHIAGMSASTPTQSRASPPSVNSSPLSESLTSVPAISDVQKETSYFEYLHDARNKLEQSSAACCQWSFRYDGENPPPDSITASNNNEAEVETSKIVGSGGAEGHNQEVSTPKAGCIERGSILKKGEASAADGGGGVNESKVTFDLKSTTEWDDSVFLPSDVKCNTKASASCGSPRDPKLSASLRDLDSFMTYLLDVDVSDEEEAGKHSASESATSLDHLLGAMSMTEHQQCSSQREDVSISDLSQPAETSSSWVDVHSLSPIPVNPAQANSIRLSEMPAHDESVVNSTALSSKTAFEDISISEAPRDLNVAVCSKRPDPNTTSFVDISVLPEKKAADNTSVSSSPEGQATPVPNNEQSQNVSSSSVFSAKKERNVPKDFPKEFFSNTNPLYAMSSSSVLSPMKYIMYPGDLSTPFKPNLLPAAEFPGTVPSCPLPGKQLKYSSDPPNIGPFLSSLLLRLEGMIGNSLYFNLLLTDVIARLAAYPQPLLRSFLLNHNLVFQPSVKSLIQVLSSLRQKLDSFSVTVKQFDNLVVSAKHNLMQREEQLYQLYDKVPGANMALLSGSTGPQPQRMRADTLGSVPKGLKKKVTLSDLFFRRSPGRDKLPMGRSSEKLAQLQKVQLGSGPGYRYINAGDSDTSSTGSGSGGDSFHSLSTWNAVYSALVLDEFLKELAALSQEHSVLHQDEGYLSS